MATTFPDVTKRQQSIPAVTSPGTGPLRGALGSQVAEAEQAGRTAGDFSQVAQALADAEFRIQERADGYARERAEEQFSEFLLQQNMAVMESEDPTDPNAVGQYRMAVDEKISEYVNSHSGTDRSKAELDNELRGMAARGSAELTGAVQVELKKRTERLIGKDLNRLTTSVYNNPGNLTQARLELRAALAKRESRLTPSELADYLAAGESILVENSVLGILGTLGAEAAQEFMMETPGLAETLDLPAQARIREAFRAAQEDDSTSLMKNLAAYQKMASDPNTPPETLALFRQSMLGRGTQVTIKNEGPIPADHRVIRDEAGNPLRYEVIPNSPTDLAQRRETESAKLAAGMAERFVQDRLTDTAQIRDLIPKAGNPGWRSVAQYVPGTDAAAMAQKLSTVKDALSFQNLINLKVQSGAGLGSVTEGELALLANLAGPLNMTTKNEFLFETLDRVDAFFNKVLAGADARAEFKTLRDSLEKAGYNTEEEPEKPPYLTTIEQAEALEPGDPFLWVDENGKVEFKVRK